MKNLLIAGALAFALFSAPVVAQECDTIESVSKMALEYGGAAEVIPADLLEKFAAAVGGSVPDGAQRAIFISGDGGSAYGYEMPDGCLTPPTFIKPSVQS